MYNSFRGSKITNEHSQLLNYYYPCSFWDQFIHNYLQPCYLMFDLMTYYPLSLADTEWPQYPP